MNDRYGTIAAWDGTLGTLTISLLHAGSETNRRSLGNDALERGLPLFDELLRAANLEPGDLQALICSVGPGGFTGLRITLSTVKGLAVALRVPLIGVSSFDVVEEMRATAEDSLSMPHATVISPRAGIVCARLRDARGETVLTASGRADEKIAELVHACEQTEIAPQALRIYEWPEHAWRTALTTAAGTSSNLQLNELFEARVVAFRDEYPSTALLRIGMRRLAETPPAADAIMENIHAVAADYGEAVSVTPPRAK